MVDRHPLTVVGVDGSPASTAAVGWAVDAGRGRARSVRLLHAVAPPPPGFPAFGYPTDYLQVSLRHGRALLQRTENAVHEAHPDVAVTTVFEREDPRSALVSASGHAELTVVGTHGRSQLQGMLVGSVASYLAAHAASPVAVVPVSREQRDGPVLVGVDGSGSCRAAIGWAFDEAAAAGTSLVAVLAWDDHSAQGSARRPTVLTESDAQEEHAVLAEQLAGWREKYPEVAVDRRVVRGHPVRRLLDVERYAPSAVQPRMIVVGSRGRGGVAGLLLGSTAQALIARAACPVVIVHPRSG